MLALDARVFLHTPDADPASLPHPAIRPYPAQYGAPWRLRDSTPVTIRPIRPDDEPLMVAFHRTLSERSVYLRYFYLLGLDARTAHDRLRGLCFVDYHRTMAFVAERRETGSGERSILGVGRLIRAHARPEAEFALLVSDRVQHQGLGTELLRRLIGVARDEGLERIVGDVLPDNDAMLTLCGELGFRRTRRQGEPVRAELDLSPR